jgi:type II secretory ATPase GspE/PulE/Tfp pilus assembly ATPase PilB-like protein
MMLALGTQLRASEVHIDPCLEPGSSDLTGRLRMRIDGIIQEIATFDLRLLGAIAGEFKQMAGADVREKPRPQAGRILTRLSDVPGSEGGSGKLVDLRASFLPTALGESVTLRFFDPGSVFMELGKIDYSPGDKQKLLKALHEPWGLIVISGPTGSGKTTVLYSCLNEVSGPQRKTVSLEDPIEFHLPWVSQVEVGESSGVTYARAIKTVLSAGPDVVMIGEIRDSETLQAALEAALSGCLVLTQLHASGAAEALRRMADFGGDPFAVAEASKLVLSQRLVRKLCPDCSERVSLSAEEIESAKELAIGGGIEWGTLKPDFRKAVGCDRCSRTGYRRRDVIAEVLEISPGIAKALRDNASVDEIRAIAVSEGMTTMVADGIRRAAVGHTTMEEVRRVLGM